MPHPPRWRSSLAACGSTSRSTYSAAVPNDTAALSSQDAGDYEYYSAESAAAGEGSSFSSDDLTSSMLDPSTVESSRKIVYNASVRMETTDYDTTRAAWQEAVTGGGPNPPRTATWKALTRAAARIPAAAILITPRASPPKTTAAF